MNIFLAKALVGGWLEKTWQIKCQWPSITMTHTTLCLGIAFTIRLWIWSTLGIGRGVFQQCFCFKCIFSRLMKCNLVRWGIIFIFDPKIVFIWFLNCYFFCLSSIAIRNIFSEICLLLKISLRKCFFLIFFASVFILAFKWVNANLY